MSIDFVLLPQILGLTLLGVFVVCATLSFVAKSRSFQRKAAIVATIAAAVDAVLQGIALTVAVSYDLHLGLLVCFVIGALVQGWRARTLTRTDGVCDTCGAHVA